MLRHVAMFKWKQGTTDEDVTAISAALEALPSQIPEIRRYRYGPDLGLSEDTWDFAVVADFDDVDDYIVYRDHPAHQAVIASEIVPRRDSRVTVQYETVD